LIFENSLIPSIKSKRSSRELRIRNIRRSFGGAACFGTGWRRFCVAPESADPGGGLGREMHDVLMICSQVPFRLMDSRGAGE